MAEPETVDAEVVEEPGTALAPAPSQTLWHTDDPAEVLTRATSTAEALMPVVRDKGLVVKIQGKDHLTVEAWLTLSAMVGVSPVCVWTRKLDNGWEARVEARTLDGRVIGAAESECLNVEARWKDAEDYAVRSMAQTRATSKALASVLRFVATLGGVSGTPAEEMDGVKTRGGSSGQSSRPASKKQKGWVVGGGGRPSLFDKATLGEGQRRALIRWLSGGDELTASGASTLIERLKDAPDKGAQELFAEMEAQAFEGDADAKAGVALLTGDVPVDTEGLDSDPDPGPEVPF